jgi:hypothetical protein
MEVIRDEYATYKTIFFRKSTRFKVVETLVFIILLVVLIGLVDTSSTEFKVGALGLGALTLGLSPLLYMLVVRPRHILTSNELIIERFGKQRAVALTSVEETYDLRFFYKIEGKKMPLMISDGFINDLDQKIEEIKKTQQKKMTK